MLDGTEGLTAPVSQIDTHILRHMLAETSDLLEEAPNYAVESARSVQAAMALTRSDWLLMAVHTWISEQLSTETVGCGASINNSINVMGIEYQSLSSALQRFVARVDRLFARTCSLETLLTLPDEEPEEPEERPEAQILHIFGDQIPAQSDLNVVLETRRRLNCAFAKA